MSVRIETASQTFVFGRLKSEEEAIAPGAEGETAERAGDDNGNRNSSDGNPNGDKMAW